jgi:hypothetical protein
MENTEEFFENAIQKLKESSDEEFRQKLEDAGWDSVPEEELCDNHTNIKYGRTGPVTRRKTKYCGDCGVLLEIVDEK